MSPEIQEWSHKSRSRINNPYLLSRPIGCVIRIARIVFDLGLLGLRRWLFTVHLADVEHASLIIF